MKQVLRWMVLGVVVAHGQIVEAQVEHAYLSNTREGAARFAEKKNEAIPFRLDGGFLITVGGRIGTIGPLKFVLDTGATHTVVSRRIAEKLSLARESGSVVNFDRQMGVEWARLPELQLGPIEARDVRVMVAELREFSEFADGVDAIIGLDVLRSSESMTIDYERNLVTFRLAREGYVNAGPTQALTVRLPMQGQAVRLILDTGLEGLLLYKDRLRAHTPHIRWDGDIYEASAGRLKGQAAAISGVRLGRDESSSMAMLLPKAPEALPGDIDGYLGTSALHARMIELDFAANKLRWE